jgi:3-hydroxyisobutyrate dehydrogenase-like beta-hydroxyacid dehydrogenase
MRRIAWIGLGGMGSRMAYRLLEAGHPLTVWNRSPERMEPLIAKGAHRAGSPAEAARTAEVIITMVADPAALRAVSEGPEGLGAGASPGLTLVEMSTVGPAAIQRLASTLSGRAEVVDAPVLGSLGEAEAGRLAIFVGGNREQFSKLEPLLTVLGSPLHAGPLGSGAAAKLVANSTLAGTMGTLGEAIALADGLGLSRDIAFRVLEVSPLGAQVQRRRAAIESGEYPRRFALSLMVKDASLVAEAAREAGVDMRILAAAASWFADAEAAGDGDRDYAAVLATITEARRQRTG